MKTFLQPVVPFLITYIVKYLFILSKSRTFWDPSVHWQKTLAYSGPKDPGCVKSKNFVIARSEATWRSQKFKRKTRLLRQKNASQWPPFEFSHSLTPSGMTVVRQACTPSFLTAALLAVWWAPKDVQMQFYFWERALVYRKYHAIEVKKL